MNSSIKILTVSVAAYNVSAYIRKNLDSCIVPEIMDDFEWAYNNITIKNALESITGIENVSANHTNGTVKITASSEVSKAVMVETIEDIGFSVKED